MSATWFLVNFCGCIAEVVLLTFYDRAFLAPKPKSRARVLALGGVSFALFLLNSLFLDIMPIRVIINLAVFWLFNCMYEGTALRRLYAAMIAYLFMNASEIITGVLTVMLLGVTLEEARNSDVLYAVNVLASKLIDFLCLKLALRYVKKDSRETDSMFTAALTALFVFILFYMAIFMDRIMTVYSRWQNVLAVISVILIWAALAALLFINDRQRRYREYQSRLQKLESQYRLQAREYENLRDKARLANKNVHDVKNFALAVSSYLEQGRVEEAQKKLMDYTRQISAGAQKMSGSVAVDALLSAKEGEIRGLCRDAYVSVVLGELHALDEIDLCILLGNAIDNAVEESRRVEDPKERSIEIRVRPSAGGISIFVRNKTAPRDAASGKASQKGDPFFHGFGLENMRAICEKYRGDFQTERRDGFFELRAFLPDGQPDEQAD